MPQSTGLSQNSRRARQQAPYVPPNPFRRVPDPPAAHTSSTWGGNTLSTNAANRAVKSGTSVRPAPSHAPSLSQNVMTNSTFAVSDGASRAAESTGAAILSSYTNRRKMLQRAAVLSMKMHKQVEDVVQMEEEQLLLSQAYRSRQRLTEPRQEQTEKAQETKQQQQQQQSNATEAGASASNEVNNNSSTQDALLPSAGEADRSGIAVGSTGGVGLVEVEEYGGVLEGAPDTKRLLQQQAQEKNETLGKMRGMQQAIQQLSSELAAMEERWTSRSRFIAETAGAADADDYMRDVDNEGSSDAHSPLNAMPPDALSKLETIRDLRTSLKDMIDASHPHSAERGHYGCAGSAVGSGGSVEVGTTWVELDALHNPPEPPQVFSINALAVTLEYMSDSMASISRIADEFCIATTFRARNERLLLQPHLLSLKKWTTQADRCFETAQRHLRHFHVGETAVTEGGAYEVNSLREQTLLVKETLTAQDQKVKSTMETKSAVLNRLREMRQRCWMWESYLLHRNLESDAGDKSLESLLFSCEGRSQRARSTTPSSTKSGDFTGYTPCSLEAAIAATTHKTSCTLDGVPSAALLELIGRGIENGNRDEAAQRSHTPTVEVSDACPPSRTPSPALLKEYLSQISGATGSTVPPRTVRARDTANPPSTSMMDRMERCIAKSWGNPYVRKQLLRRRAEAANAPSSTHEQQMQQQLYGAMLYPSLPLAAVQVSVEGASGNEPAVLRSTSPFYDGARGEREGPNNVDAKASVEDPRAVKNTPRTLHLSSQRPPSGCKQHRPHRTTSGDGNRPRSSHDKLPRRSQVPLNPLRVPSPGAGEGGDRKRVSCAFGSTASMTNMLSGIGEQDAVELADTRALQLLQSLLRSVKASHLPPRQVPDSKEAGSTNLASQTGGSTEAPSGVDDVTPQEAFRDLSRRSMQRLINFFKAHAKQPNPRQLSMV